MESNKERGYYTQQIIEYKLRQLSSDREIDELDFQVDAQVNVLIEHMGATYLYGAPGGAVKADTPILTFKMKLRAFYVRYLKKYRIIRYGVSVAKRIKRHL